MNRLSLKDLSRSGHVTRWHSVRTHREQTLAEHHYMVAMISLEMGKRILGSDLQDAQKLLMLEYALRHDTPELVLGDLPTPIKRRIEAACQPDPISALEREVCADFAAAQDAISGTPLALIVKLADFADALSFISSEGNGNHAGVVTEKTWKGFRAKIRQACTLFPQYPWNLAEDVVDELLNGQDSHIEFES